MSTRGDNVARRSRDGAETPHATPVIPLRRGAAAPPPAQPREPLDAGRRRAEALRLSRDEQLSLREVGERLGVSKDTAARDIKAARAQEQAARKTARDTGETSHETGGGSETPAGGGSDILVLVLDEPLRQALAVLRSKLPGSDTPEQNTRVARAAIRTLADTLRQEAAHGPAPEGGDR